MAVCLSVVIATHNRDELLQRTLHSLAQCTFPKEYARTIVVENGSRGPAESIVQSFPEALNFNYLHVEHGNKSSALNEALEQVEGGLVFFTDDDVRFSPDILNEYLAAAQGVDSGCCYGGPFGVDAEQAVAPWLAEYQPFSAKGWSLEQNPEASRQLFVGFNWAAFADDIKASGGFDPQFGPGSGSGSTGQESSMQRRMRARGIRSVYVSAAKVWHFVPEERSSEAWTLQRVFRSRIQRGLGYRGGEGPEIAGYPLKELAELILRSTAMCLLPVTIRRRDRFHLKYKLQYCLGFFEGRRQALKAKK